jgi:hypothetical protein
MDRSEERNGPQALPTGSSRLAPSGTAAAIAFRATTGRFGCWA